MKASEVQAYLQSLRGDWSYPADTVDTFKAGNPDDEVRGIAVGWMSYTWALREALRFGCNMFITHEPTYYNHRDNDETIFRFEGAREKRAFIEANGLIIVRCHDLWDQILGIGIPDSWGQLLGFEYPVDSTRHLRVYEIETANAAALARHVAQRTAPFGQPGVHLIGSPDASVKRVSIGTGAITPFLTCVEKFNVDCAICTDDGIANWRDGGFAIDMGIPLIVVHHHVSEEVGIISLANHLKRTFSEIPVFHIPQQCMYQLITA
ncbi:MAG: Nif3-like dinuclear metal center hexameric protein [Anaerolineae bacterium]|nr:Nif3-like dinuclear metal center hexameric protein [Anaerolineae bacterium]